MKTVCHISSLHTRNDTRIFLKECVSLSYTYKVYYVVSDGLGDQFIDNINIIDSGKRLDNRFFRIFISSIITIIKAVRIKASVYHIHDPELLLYLFLIRLFRPKSKIIFDVHENVSKSIRNKEYLRFKIFIQFFYSLFEKLNVKRLYKILAEDSYIKESVYSKKSVIVRNYPILSKFENKQNLSRKENIDLFYIGSITKERGLYEMCTIVQNIDNKDSRLHLIGHISDNLRQEIESYFNSGVLKRIIFHGRLGIDEGYEISKNCKLGLALLHPIKNYIESYPTKIFEYTACGLPFLVSDFPLYKDVVNNLKTGFCIDPEDSKQHISLVNKILSNEIDIEESSRKGLIILGELYNWDNEAEKLKRFYSEIL